MPSMPYAQLGIHACEHASLLAGLPGTPNESTEHKERVAAPFHTLCRGRVAGAALGAALKWQLLLNG